MDGEAEPLIDKFSVSYSILLAELAIERSRDIVRAATETRRRAAATCQEAQRLRASHSVS